MVTRARVVAAIFLHCALCCAAGSCGWEGALFGELTRGDQVQVPGAGKTRIVGRASGLSGASVAFLTGAGDALLALGTSVEAGGEFAAEAPGASELTNLIVVVKGKGGFAWGLVPSVPRQESVMKEPPPVVLADRWPAMADLGDATTLVSLMVIAKARGSGLSFSALLPATTAAAIDSVAELRTAGNEQIGVLADMLGRLLAPGATPVAALRPAPPPGGSFLDTAALGTVDYDGDGHADSDTAAFDAALSAAIGELQLESGACYEPDRIRLVLLADLRPGGLDRNCSAIERFRWAADEPGKSMFVTGAIHKDTPRCGDAPPPCLDDASIDAANQLMGNWTPNQIRMYDDGTHGDAVSGDGVWTLALDWPYFDPPDSGAAPGAGVRIGYKYTWGHPGQGWTESEEWPGNKRILELRDLNGDHIVTRRDYFGDETTNKDKANLLTPANGGCGKVVFPGDDSPEMCANDSVESMVDTDGDCELDTWPAPGAATPLTVDCPGE